MLDLVPLALAKDIEIGIEQRSPRRWSPGDAGLLGILFRNVITIHPLQPPHTHVHVDVTTAASEVRIAIRDAGPGIGADERAQVGRRFYVWQARAPAAAAALGSRLPNEWSNCMPAPCDSTFQRRGRDSRSTISLPSAVDAGRGMTGRSPRLQALPSQTNQRCDLDLSLAIPDGWAVRPGTL